MRVYLLTLFAMCLLGLGVAHAKKSRFSVKNCTGDTFRVKVFNGDDREQDVARANKILKTGETQKLNCKVNSGKKRCFLKLQRNDKDWSKSMRVKGGRTVYVTAVSIREGKRVWGTTRKETVFTANTEGCPALVR